MGSPTKGVWSPLQLLGRYIGWMETAVAGGVAATWGVAHWARTVLMVVLASGVALYVATACFVVIYLAVTRPELLYNPSAYDPSVQAGLFGRGIKLTEDASQGQRVELPAAILGGDAKT